MKILDCKQGSLEWHEARCGIPTASEFASVMSKGRGNAESKTRRTYMMKLLAEKITGQIASYGNSVHMERGHLMEPKARDAYTFKAGRVVKQVGFIRNAIAGYSPDGLVGDDGAIEIKSKLPHLHLDVMLKGEMPSEHKAQVQGGLWVSQRKWCDFVSYCPGLPMFIKRVERDIEYIDKLSTAVAEFVNQMRELEERIEAIR